MLSIVSNTSTENIDTIEEEMFLMNCPLPIYNGDVTELNIAGFTVTYNVTYYPSISNFNGTFFDCYIDDITDNFSVSAISKPYDETLFSVIPIGWYGYIADWLTASFERIQHFFTLVGIYVSPAGFNILGYGLGDLEGIALMTVILIYAICYISIGAMVYKIVSPFAGVS